MVLLVCACFSDIVNMIENKPLKASSSNLVHMSLIIRGLKLSIFRVRGFQWINVEMSL